STLDEKLLFANSPSLLPRPVKSKRSTAMPRSASVRLMRAAAKPSLEHVKQCAKRAYARGVPAGRSRRAASRPPCDPGNLIFSTTASCISYRISSARIVRIHVAHHRRHGGSANGDGSEERLGVAPRPLDQLAGVREVRGGDVERARRR